MKIDLDLATNTNIRMLIRRAGYAEKINRRGEVSYVRRIAGAEYPRFHAYIDKTNRGIRVNLHLDQKAASYGKHTAHSGEYGGELVEAEAARLKSELTKNSPFKAI